MTLPESLSSWSPAYIRAATLAAAFNIPGFRLPFRMWGDSYSPLPPLSDCPLSRPCAHPFSPGGGELSLSHRSPLCPAPDPLPPDPRQPLSSDTASLFRSTYSPFAPRNGFIVCGIRLPHDSGQAVSRTTSGRPGGERSNGRLTHSCSHALALTHRLSHTADSPLTSRFRGWGFSCLRLDISCLYLTRDLVNEEEHRRVGSISRRKLKVDWQSR